jgi:hypothetical protein
MSIDKSEADRLAGQLYQGVDDLLDQLGRAILDSLSVEVSLYDDDGNVQQGGDDLVVDLHVRNGHIDGVSRRLSLNGLLSAFQADELSQGEELVESVWRLRAISAHAAQLATQLRDIGVAAGVPAEDIDNRVESEAKPE